MAFSRTAMLRSTFRGARPTAVRPHVFRQVTRRAYSSAHGSAKAGGDALWAAGAVAVTVPTCWYLLSNGPDTSHGHGGHDDGHGESQEESEPEQESKDEAEDKSEEKAEESADDKESDKSEDSDDEKAADTPDTSDDEGESKDGNTVKRIPDAKGGFKKRLESENAITQGEGPTKGGEGEPTDKAAASKEPGDKNSQSGKQEGLTNTDTKHSTDITNNPDKSTKGEGTPETSKSKGTVDPNRPQPEDK